MASLQAPQRAGTYDLPSPAVRRDVLLLRVRAEHRFTQPVQVIFGARDRYLNPQVTRNFAALFPTGSFTCSTIDQLERVADLTGE